MRTICALLLLATPTLADNCHVRGNRVVISSTGVAITPYAVPVAVPVAAVVPGYLYSHAGAQGYTAQSQSADAKLFAEFLEWKKSREAAVTTQTAPQTLLQQNCVGCHTPGNPLSKQDAIDHFDMSGELTDKQKLAAIKAVMLGTMPKAKTLDPQVRADTVAELSGVEK